MDYSLQCGKAKKMAAISESMLTWLRFVEILTRRMIQINENFTRIVYGIN